MITFLTSAAFVVYFAILWVTLGGSFPVLARHYLWVSPFLPLVGLFNHNFDHDRFGAPMQLIPAYVMLGLLALSLANWSDHLLRLRLGTQEICLGLYALITLIQIPLSVDPVWSLCTWSWSVPGYFLFLMAGRFTTVEDLSSSRYAFWAVLGFLAINLSLIAYGLLIGRADTLFLTRNFGSFYASTAMLLFLALFSGPAWLAVRSSRFWSYVFFIASGTSVILSLSRTALIVIPLVGAFLLSPVRKRRAGRIGLVLLTAGTGVVVAMLLAKYVDMDSQLYEVWDQRLSGGHLWEAYLGASDARLDELGGYRDRILKETMIVGWGYGTFRWFSIYADAHNLFITEAFENGFVAAIILFLSFAIPRAIRALANHERRPIAASLLSFLLIAQLSGGMLSNRAPGQYYSALPGWALFFLAGCLSSRKARPTQVEPAPAPASSVRPSMEHQ